MGNGNRCRHLSGPGGALIALAAAAGAGAQTAPPAPKASLEEVIVTGTLLKRTDAETPTPVQVVTAEQLAQSGYTNVSDVLRNLSANGAGTLSQSFNYAFAGGGSGVALRGLSVGNTLTLIDGHRMVAYPLSDDGQRSFVDVSSIPFNAIDSVEVLKGAASAQYGSDAIAGVVNIKLKKSFVGTEITAETGTSQKRDANLAHFAGISGFGDMASDGYNAYLSFEYRHEGSIAWRDRSTAAYEQTDWTGVGGVNTAPGAGTNPTVAYPDSLTGYLVNPGSTGAPYAFLPGCSAAAQAADRCTYIPDGLLLQPATSNFNVLAKVNAKLGGDWTMSLAGSLFDSKAEQTSGGFPGTGYSNGGLYNISLQPGQAPKTVPFPYTPLTVPANYPGNPYGAPAALVYNFHELGLPTTFYDTQTFRFIADFDGTALGWDVRTSAGAMYAITRQTATGALAPAALQTALNNGYILGSTGANALFAPDEGSSQSSALNYLNANASRTLYTLPGGPLGMAIGAEFFQKKLNATAAPNIASGLQSGNNAYAIGNQDDTAAFVEFDAPIVKQLEIDAAVRYDHYNTYGSSTTPKVGFKFKPIPQFVVRGSWGEGFRAPNAAEAGLSGSGFGAGTIPDPVLCPNANNANAPGNFPSQCSLALVGVQTSNAALKPEKSTQYTFGAIFEPSSAFSVSVDYYDIKINQDIISAFEAGGFLNTTFQLPPLTRGNPVTLPYVNANGQVVNQQTPVGLILFQPYPYVNASQTETSGLDLEVTAKQNFGRFGQLHEQLNYTYILKYDLLAYGTTYQLAGTHGPSGVSGDTGNPKGRAVLEVAYDLGRLTVSANVNWISSFNVTDPSANQNTCAAAIYAANSTTFGSRFQPGAQFPTSFCSVASFTDVDLYAKYQLTDKFDIHGSVLNALNTPPPLDMATYGGAGGAPVDSAMHQAGVVGRYFTIGGTYRF